MQAELIMVGTELLLGEVLDTNSQWLATRLAEIGIDVYFKNTVGDNWTRMAGVLAQALSRSDVVIVAGGLGPTQDDLTRRVIAGVTGRPLVRAEEAEKHVRRYFQDIGRPLLESTLQQAWFPDGARPIPNERGTALGMILDLGAKLLVALPGVPSELEAMVLTHVLPLLASRQGSGVTYSRVLRFWGLGESALEEMVRDIIEQQTNPTLAPYAGAGEARLRITARAEDAPHALMLIETLESEIRLRTGSFLYGVDDTSLEQVINELLTERQATVATAESCTGGLIAHRITNVQGSSRCFLRGWVTYSNESKSAELGVPTTLLAEYGAVSAPVARAMASGARQRAHSTYALSATGIAGPGGGSTRKPVGLVYVGLAGPGNMLEVEEFRFRGYRGDIKMRSASAALNMLRLALTAG